MPILGTVKLQLQIAGGTYRCDFHVVQNLTYEAVLGLDFPPANEAVIDLKSGILNWMTALQNHNQMTRVTLKSGLLVLYSQALRSSFQLA